MKSRNEIVAAIVGIAMSSAVFYYIVAIGNHYIMPLYYMMYGGMSEVYPHYYETYEAAAIAALVGIIVGYFTLGILKIIAKIKFPQQKGNSPMSQ
jgi:hypothetical protein